MRSCRQCADRFAPRGRERICSACLSRVVLVECSECHDVFQANRLGRRSGRPRKTCDASCAIKRQLRLRFEERRQDRMQARQWWLSLSCAERGAAMAWALANPPPLDWKGGKQGWAWFCRASFSCEGKPVSLEAA